MPLTAQEHNRQLGQPPLCEQLKVRDITDDLLIHRTTKHQDPTPGTPTNPNFLSAVA